MPHTSPSQPEWAMKWDEVEVRRDRDKKEREIKKKRDGEREREVTLMKVTVFHTWGEMVLMGVLLVSQL